MQDLGNEVPLRLSTAEGSDIDVTAVLDEAGQAWLKSAMAGKAAIEVQLRPSEEDDVRAHAVDGGVLVRVTIGGGEDDDVEGHAMSLHFPSMEAARDFERRLLATGLIAGTVAVSIVGVGVSSQTHTGAGSISAPLAGDAPTVQYAPTARDTDRGDLSAPVFTIQTGSGEHIGLTEAAAGAAAATTAQYAPAVRDTDRGDLGAIAPTAGSPATTEHVGLTEAATGAAAATTPQYAPTVRDSDRGDLSAAASGSSSVTTDHVGGYITAAGAAASAATDPQAPPVGGYMTAAGAAAATGSAVDPRANDTVGGYMTAAGAAAATGSAVDPRANDTVGGYQSAAAAAAASSRLDLGTTVAGSRSVVTDQVGGYMTAAGAAAATGSATDEHVGLSEMATGAGAAAEAPQYAPTVRDTDRGDLGTPAASDKDQELGQHPV